MDGVASPWAGRLSLGWLTLSGASPLNRLLRRPRPVFGCRPEVCEAARRYRARAAEKPWLFADIASRLGIIELRCSTWGASGSMAGLRWTGARARSRPVRCSAPGLSSRSFGSERRRAIDHFASLCEECSKLGMSVVIEFFAYSAVRTIEEAASVVTASTQENAGILVDALHLYRSGDRPNRSGEFRPGRYCLRKSATRRSARRCRPGFPTRSGTTVSMRGRGACRCWILRKAFRPTISHRG